MMAAPSLPTTPALLRRARRRWPRLALACLAAMGVALGWLLATPAQYHASMIVAPTVPLVRDGHDRMRDSAAVVLSGLGLADDQMGTEFSRFLDLLRSVEVARRLIAEPGLLVALFPDQWDAATASWHPPRGPMAQLSALIDRVLGRPGWSPPDAVDLARRLDRLLVDQPVGASGLRRLTLRHRDRETALALLTALHGTTDSLLRSAALRQADAQIAYLHRQFDRTSRAEHRLALTHLLSWQERRLMLIHTDLAFAAHIADPPAAPARPDWPPPLPVLALAAAAGLLVGLCGVMLEAMIRPGPDGRPEEAAE